MSKTEAGSTPQFKIGDEVIIRVDPTLVTGFTSQALSRRIRGEGRGCVLRLSDAHGLCYEVTHETEAKFPNAYYEPHELSPMPNESELPAFQTYLKLTEFHEHCQLWAVVDGTILLAPPGYSAGFRTWAVHLFGENGTDVMSRSTRGVVSDGWLRAYAGGLGVETHKVNHRSVLTVLDLYDGLVPGRIRAVALGSNPDKSAVQARYPSPGVIEFTAVEYRRRTAMLYSKEVQDLL